MTQTAYGHGTRNRDPRDRSADERRCDHPACTETGLHPAPKDRSRLRDYFWFCKPHAREYNATWNYCAGFSQDDIDRIVREDVVWNRPTWPLGMQRVFRHARPTINDSFDIDEDGGRDSSGDGGGTGHPLEPDTEARNPDVWAVRILDLIPPVSLTEVKARYKEIVKKLHPDINGGDKVAEDQLKEINRAYTYLKTTLSGLKSRSV